MKKKPSRKDVAKMFFNVPKKVRAEFKARCAKEGVSMTDKLVNFMRNGK